MQPSRPFTRPFTAALRAWAFSLCSIVALALAPAQAAVVSDLVAFNLWGSARNPVAGIAMQVSGQTAAFTGIDDSPFYCGSGWSHEVDCLVSELGWQVQISPDAKVIAFSGPGLADYSRIAGGVATYVADRLVDPSLQFDLAFFGADHVQTGGIRWQFVWDSHVSRYWGGTYNYASDWRPTWDEVFTGTVPLPGTLPLVLTSLAGLVLARWRRVRTAG